jgi:F-type H+-transporting ATPase subunit b
MPSEFNPGDIGQAIAALLAFGLLLAVLGRWAWKPIVTQLRAREADIAASIERARKLQAEAQELHDQHKARLDRAESEAQEIAAAARRAGAEARENILALARQEAQEVSKRARTELERARGDALVELRQATAAMAAEIAARVVRRELTDAERQRLLDDSLEEIIKHAGPE